MSGLKNMATLSSEFQKRLEKIRVQFLFDHPFLSVLALSLDTHFQLNTHEAFETDGVNIFIDEARCSGLDDGRLKYTYAHILLHIMLKHAFRMKGREHGVWNRSSDIVINLLLNDFDRIGERPEDEVFLEKFRNQSVEEVYNALYRESKDGEGTPDEQNPQQEKRDLIENSGKDSAVEEEIDAVIAQAMGAAHKQGNIPASFKERITEIINPQTDLETLLHSYLSESFFDKESDFSHPNRRFVHQGLYLPGYRLVKNRLNVLIGLDISMSIDPKTFSKFLGIIDGVLRLGSEFEVTVIPFDAEVDPSQIVTYDIFGVLPPVAFEKGNGGTDLSVLFDYIDTTSFDASLLIVLSDGFVAIKEAPPLQTLFLISRKENQRRFEAYGDTVYFDL